MKDFWIYIVHKAEFKTNQSVAFSKWQSLVNPAQNQTQNKEALPNWISVQSYYLGNSLYHKLLSTSAEQVYRTTAFLHLKFECYRRDCTAKSQGGTKFHRIFSVALLEFALGTKAEEQVWNGEIWRFHPCRAAPLHGISISLSTCVHSTHDGGGATF